MKQSEVRPPPCTLSFPAAFVQGYQMAVLQVLAHQAGSVSPFA